MQYKCNMRLAVIVVVLVLILASLACGGTKSDDTAAATQPAQVQQTALLAAAATATPPPQPANTPEPAEPIQFLDLSGTTAISSDTFRAEECYKTVFGWTTKANSMAQAALIVKLREAASGAESIVVNALELNLESAAGSALAHVESTEYSVITDNVSGPWTLQVTCYDGQPAAGEGLDLQGEGQTVTANLSPPGCTNSALVWSVEPDASGMASVIVDLHEAQAHTSTRLVNTAEMGRTETLKGEALAPVAAGVYFLVVDNDSGPWSVRWECRD
jgi:hypothetical protein